MSIAHFDDVQLCFALLIIVIEPHRILHFNDPSLKPITLLPHTTIVSDQIHQLCFELISLTCLIFYMLIIVMTNSIERIHQDFPCVRAFLGQNLRESIFLAPQIGHHLLVCINVISKLLKHFNLLRYFPFHVKSVKLGLFFF